MNDILTLQEVAEFLQLSDKTIMKMIKNGEIPCAKIANQWRFSKAMLEDWVMAQMKVIPQNDLSRLVESEFEYIPLSRLIDQESIIMDLRGRNSEEVLRELAEEAYKKELVSDREKLISKLLERESLTSTSIGKGIALPHLRKPCGSVVSRPKIIIGVSCEGIDFASFDGDKTTHFFLILSDSEVVHLRLLSRLTRILGLEGAVEEVKKLKTPKEIIQFFMKKDQEINSLRSIQ